VYQGLRRKSLWPASLLRLSPAGSACGWANFAECGVLGSARGSRLSMWDEERETVKMDTLIGRCAYVAWRVHAHWKMHACSAGLSLRPCSVGPFQSRTRPVDAGISCLAAITASRCARRDRTPRRPSGCGKIFVRCGHQTLVGWSRRASDQSHRMRHRRRKGC
jgi:hypothetical protein